MEIYLIRHTTPAVEKGICYGQTDLNVAATFENEAKTVHEQVLYDADTKIYSSPLVRCSKLAKTFGSKIEYDNRLMELNFGKWEMQAWNDIPADEMNPWMNNFVTTPVPQGESYTMLQERMIHFFKSLLDNPVEKSIVIAHAGSIRALLAYLTKTPLKDSFSIQLNYGHVLLLEKKDDTFAVTKGLVLK